jgi:hypothetical protein
LGSSKSKVALQGSLAKLKGVFSRKPKKDAKRGKNAKSDDEEDDEEEEDDHEQPSERGPKKTFGVRTHAACTRPPLVSFCIFYILLKIFIDNIFYRAR